MTTEHAVSEKQQKVKIALSAGGVFLVVGACLVAFAMLRPSGNDNAAEKTDAINLTAGAATPTGGGPALEVVPSKAASPTPKATKKAPPVAKPSTPAPKPTKAKPKPKKTVTRVKPQPNTPYLLRNVITGNCVSTLVFNVKTTQEACSSVGKIRLEPTRAVDGVQVYRLREGSGANLCLDLPNRESEAAGTAIVAIDCVEPSPSDNQEWKIQDSGRTSKGRAVYFVVNFKSGNCLDVQFGAADKSDRPTGVDIGIATCNDPTAGYDDHYWVFS